ncbi:MAG: uroporphyrinogen decarboxylase family protein [Clostridia bacterium]|nr:uroporphyrinogen decarboxylase family protein [Clostridia bacterium]MBQ3168357.1 uroporphyrinogen decarboxylase family protein [Clostridia bacterium]
MHMNQWVQSLIGRTPRRGMPVLSFPSISLMNITVRELIESPDKQAEGMKRIADLTDSLASVSMMDLSVEAEAFGSAVHISDDEVPTVTGAIISSEEEAASLAVPAIGAGRTGRYIKAIQKAKSLITDRPVFAGVIGPFSLAGRLMDVSEALVNCYDDPDFVHAALEKTTEFLISYINAYKDAGADGVVMAEPLGGLLSPRLAGEFSCDYIRRIVSAVQTDDFILIYHNCGDNVFKQFDDILKIGAAAYHVGNSTDIRKLLEIAPKDVVIMGNIDPAGQFLNGTPDSIYTETTRLMQDACEKHPNFVISSGCDIPPKTPWENIHAFYKAISDYNERG